MRLPWAPEGAPPTPTWRTPSTRPDAPARPSPTISKRFDARPRRLRGTCVSASSTRAREMTRRPFGTSARRSPRSPDCLRRATPFGTSRRDLQRPRACSPRVPDLAEVRGLSGGLRRGNRFGPIGGPRAIAPALVGLVTLLVFLPALGNQFVNWDDDVNLVSNPHFRGLGWVELRWMFGNTLGGHYIPVTWLSFGLDYVLWGMRPAGYHATSVVLHTANAILFYFVARRLLRSAVQAGEGELTLGAAAAALLLSLHPLRVESVAWATERRDVLMGFFALLCVVSYLRAIDRAGGGALHSGWYWTAVGLFGLALLSKSVVVGLPVVLLLLDVYPLRRSAAESQQAGGRTLFRLALEKIPFALLAAAVAAVTLTVGAGHRLM